MDTNNLYIASLRERRIISLSPLCYYHQHIQFILVESSSGILFRDVDTGKFYAKSLVRKKSIDVETIKSFNDVTGNTKQNMTKRKALTLFNNYVGGKK